MTNWSNWPCNQGAAQQQQQQPPPSPSQPRMPLDGSVGARRADRNDALEVKLRQMRLPLAPLVQLTSGQIHPSFPPTLLNFWLLTDAQLDELAHFYHQRTPCQWTRHYPCPITWQEGLSIEEKRRKIGKFIGLRGWNKCETPLHVKSEDEIIEEARQARLREDEDEAVRRKIPWYR
ncbi:hypothetical protein J7T55_008536 [Diaporthe amygdali]|uniref:uncharacterized protein n=1 Tax=Phomopsis amygdali TaxID=1214568 RepID=UPI0022FDBD00|nr:uncharacterized protein J7T55_008536 [Diaporthe amygdali]KAJ0121372.1 hypothetical protein J7T55_008536 [Diaporthe amygdali]